jgi:hypothetical protein
MPTTANRIVKKTLRRVKIASFDQPDGDDVLCDTVSGMICKRIDASYEM